jgi:hypothetical protein
MGSRRIRQFGKDPDKLAVKLFWSVLVILRSVPDECHQGGIPTDQSCGDVPVVIKIYRRDIFRPDELGPIVLSHPHVRRIHACLLLPLSHAGAQLTRAVDVGRDVNSTATWPAYFATIAWSSCIASCLGRTCLTRLARSRLTCIKPRDVVRKIGKAAGQRGVVREPFKEGGNHTIYLLGGKRIPVSRHTEIDDGLAEKMFRECEEVLGRGWWR